MGSAANRNSAAEARKASAQQYIKHHTDEGELPPSVNEIIGIQPYKKQYINGVPGSSPVIRS